MSLACLDYHAIEERAFTLLTFRLVWQGIRTRLAWLFMLICTDVSNLGLSTCPMRPRKRPRREVLPVIPFLAVD